MSIGTVMKGLLLTDPERASRFVTRGRRAVQLIDTDLKTRNHRDILEQKAKYEKAQSDKEEKAAQVAIELEAMKLKALTWIHCPLFDRSERAVHGAARRTESTALTINSLVSGAVEANPAAKTGKQKMEAGIQFVVGWLTVFAQVHHLNNVEELERYFHNGKGRRSRDRVPLSLEQLKAGLADCSAYVHDRDRRHREQEAAQQAAQEVAQEENNAPA
jgi:hypothetical protein